MSEENKKDTMRQGDNYEEESEESPKPKKQKVEVLSSSSKPQIPVKLLAIIGGAIVLILAGYFAYGYFVGDKEEEAPPEEESFVDDFEEELIFDFAYTEEEWAQLREAGFSDADIVQYEENQADPVQLIEDATKAIDQQIKDRYAELKEEARIKGSPEYNALLDKTWLGMEPKTIKGDAEGSYDTYFVKENVSYVKMGVRGHQPILRLKSHDYGTMFHMTDHSTYMKLRDSGNIVIMFNVTNVNEQLIVSNIQTEIVDSIPTIE